MTENPSIEEKLETKFFLVDEDSYGKDYKTHLLEQYKLCIEMADKNSARRSVSNNFFLSLNSILIALIGVISQISSNDSTIFIWWISLVSVAGLLFCILWSSNIRCYRELSTAKFKVITKIEKKLPIAAFENEWDCLNPKDGNSKYPQLTKVEIWIPRIFAGLYVILLILSLTLAILPFF